MNAFDRLTFDVTGFYNRYDHVRGTQTISLTPPTGTLANNLDVTTLGIGRWRVTSKCMIVGVFVEPIRISTWMWTGLSMSH
ncbi:MAG: hypothetical protein R3B83_03880 [Nitrospirales bacterium]|nr:hypothetical protein [Nitrospirales bacterium]